MKRWLWLGLAVVSIFLIMPVVMSQAAGPEVPDQDIVQTLEADGRFSLLLESLDMANVTGTLKEEGPFTLFAPTDSAFLKLTTENDTDFVMEVYRKADQLMMYHVISGTLPVDDLILMEHIPTLLPGKSLTVTVGADSIMVNDATLLETDIAATNGLVDVIDSVLLVPPGEWSGTEGPLTSTMGIKAADPSTFDTVFPVLAGAENFMKPQGDMVMYQTAHTLDEILEFYRAQFAAMGLTERALLTVVNDTMFSAVFDGWEGGDAVVVQTVDLGQMRNVTVRFEGV